MPTGAELIVAERVRQIQEEGWTPEHDDEHGEGQIAWAAVCYAAPEQVYTVTLGADGNPHYMDPWPWNREWDKRGKVDRVRDLVKAGALIAAEIDRILRAQEM